MEEENKDREVGDPFKILFKEALKKQRNIMMDNFSHILRQLPTDDTSSFKNHTGGATPFKVQVKFDIPIFECHIDENLVDKWSNLLDGYFSVHDFSNRENINFSLLKVTPHVKDWWETYCDQKDKVEPSLFSTPPTWNYF